MNLPDKQELLKLLREADCTRAENEYSMYVNILGQMIRDYATRGATHCRFFKSAFRTHLAITRLAAELKERGFVVSETRATMTVSWGLVNSHVQPAVHLDAGINTEFADARYKRELVEPDRRAIPKTY